MRLTNINENVGLSVISISKSKTKKITQLHWPKLELKLESDFFCTDMFLYFLKSFKAGKQFNKLKVGSEIEFEFMALNKLLSKEVFIRLSCLIYHCHEFQASYLET